MRIAVVAALLIASLPALLSAAPAAQSPAPAVHSGMLASTEWLAAHLRDPDLVILCISADREFCRSHIPGARALPLSQIVAARDGIPNELPPVEDLRQRFQRAGVTNTSHIILYSDRLGIDAARAYFTLDYLGIAAHAALLDGGIERWRQQKRPESTGGSASADIHLDIHLNPAVLVDTPQMRQLSRDRPANTLLLDARRPEEFSGASPADGLPRAGHIPGALNLYWRQNLLSAGDPRLRSAFELFRLYTSLGASPAASNASSVRVITYCHSGMQSSLDYFVAKYLGFDAAMYDASFFAWTRAGLPIEKSVP